MFTKKLIYSSIFFGLSLFAADVSKINLEEKDVIGNTIKILENTTPEQEFILGKRLAAENISDEMYSSKHKRVKYLSDIVNSLVLSSDRPYVFDGYKVILVKNKSFNAQAYPGGIIVINDGIFKVLKNEDQLAGILAHEIGHIQEKHNIDTDKGFKIDDAMSIASVVGIQKNIDNKYVKSLSYGLFQGVSNSIVHGYGVDQEAEADALGLKLLIKAGYDPKEFLNTFKILKKLTNSYGGANYPKDRLERLEKLLTTIPYDEQLVLSSKKKRLNRYRKYD